MKNNSRGFTMIEMMLSMAFVAFLMVTIAMTTISMGKTYEKGLTLSHINEAGRLIITDIQATAEQSTGTVATGGNSNTSILCFGNFSYVMNKAKPLADNVSGLVKYSGGPLNGQPVHMAKVPDAGGSRCASSIIKPIDGTTATELLPSGDRNLAVQAVTPPQPYNSSHNALQTLVGIGFTLGTNNQEALVDGACRPPTDTLSDTDYCAVNSFQFIVRLGGSKS